MAETNQFNIEVGVDTKDSISKLKELGSTLEGVASKVKGSTSSMSGSFTAMASKLGSSLQSVGSTMSAGLTAPLALLGTSLFKSAAQMEQISVSFEVFTGSAETAKNMLGQLKAQALNSPMQFQDITKGAQTLLGYGLTAQQVIPITKMLGDVSGGNADKFGRLSLAFGQVNAAGRLMGQETRQMINAGFNPLQAISDKTGESMASLSERMKDGKISVQEVADAFTYATSEGGRFYGMADKQSQTLQGQLNKLSESVTFAMAEIGQSLADAGGVRQFFVYLSAVVETLKNRFLSLSPEAKSSFVKIAAFLTLLGPAAFVIGGTITALINLSKAIGLVRIAMTNLMKSNAIGWLLLALPLLAAGLGLAIEKFQDFGNEIDATITKANNAIYSFRVESVGESIDKLKAQISSLQKNPINPTLGIYTQEEATNRITKLKNELVGLEQIYKKLNPSNFNKKPPGMDGDTNKKERFIESPLDFSQEYDTYLKQFTEHRNKLIKQSQDSEREFDNIGLSGARKKLAILADGFVKQKAEYVKYGVDVNTITKNYLLKTAQLQGEVDAERIGALTGLMDRSIAKNGLKQVIEDTKTDSKKLSDVFDNLKTQDKDNAFVQFGTSIYAAQKDFAMNIANGFGEIAGAALAGNLTVSEAFDALGNMFLGTIGDLLIQMGTSAVQFGLFKEGLEKGLTAAFGGGGALVAVGLGAIVAGYALKGTASKAKTGSKAAGTAPNMKMPSVASKASGASYQYGGASYAAQTMRLMIDLTGSITATQTGYSINKSFETTLRVTGR